MRTLNRKQKKLIREWAGSEPLERITFTSFPYEIYEELQEINDHETIWQNVNNFISELYDERVHNREEREREIDDQERRDYL